MRRFLLAFVVAFLLLTFSQPLPKVYGLEEDICSATASVTKIDANNFKTDITVQTKTSRNPNGQPEGTKLQFLLSLKPMIASMVRDNGNVEFILEDRVAPNPIQHNFIIFKDGNVRDPANYVCEGTFTPNDVGQQYLNPGTNPEKTPSPTPPLSLPQCGNWVDSNNNPIPLEPPIVGSQDNYLKRELAAGHIDMKYIEQLRCASINTAIGNVSTEPQGFVKRIFEVVLGLAGGIALILVIISGYKFMASQGNPEAVKSATEQLTSAIVGLLFIIFAFVILQIIGVDILRIPGFK